MSVPTSSQIRQQFLDFFEARGHTIVPYAPLVPQNDPTVLFTNAGMLQFKDVFLGIGTRPYKRAADSQKCLRVSGKHNDLEEVGPSPYHHTLFEMLGNWSFGDYYKREAIRWAWELLTDVWGLPKDRLYVTCFEDDKSNLPRDDEAVGFWQSETDMDPSHILFFGRKDNFWAPADTGPCGPNSEIHLDYGPQACDMAHVPGHVCAVNGDCRRFIEIWNLVFIQYDRQADGSLKDLPAKHVDTGMGFERVVAVLQGVDTNYDTDLFTPILDRAQEMLGHTSEERQAEIVRYRILADHARALAFLIGDGVLPGNEGRNYVLRLILRRAARHGKLLGFDGPFLAPLAELAIEIMGHYFVELKQRRAFILDTITQEERRFQETLDVGLDRFTVLADARRQLAEEATHSLRETSRQLVEAVVGRLQESQQQLLQAAVIGLEEVQRRLAEDTKVLVQEGHQRLMEAAMRRLQESQQRLLEAAVIRPEEVQQRLAEATRVAVQQSEQQLAEVAMKSLQEHYWSKIVEQPLLEREWKRVLQPVQEAQQRVLAQLARQMEEALSAHLRTIPGREAFRLYDTYGFPLDLTRDIARERGFTVDETEFQEAMAEQRARARAAQKFFTADAVITRREWRNLAQTDFVGYHTLQAQARVLSLTVTNQAVDRVTEGQQVEVVLDRTPFYAEAGGQVGDTGVLGAKNGTITIADTRAPVGPGLIVHYGDVARGRVAVGDLVQATVNVDQRHDIARNHTASHLLHHVLRSVLGQHVQQAGSLVTPERFRFDFTHPQALTPEELRRVESQVNDLSLGSHPVRTAQSGYREAVESGVIALFDEKYGDVVRVVSIGEGEHPFSRELCGGVHCHTTGEIGLFLITGESSVGAGLRRIEAVTGHAALDLVRARWDRLQEVAEWLACSPDEVPARIEALQQELRDRERELEDMRRQGARMEFESLLSQIQEVRGVPVLAAVVTAPDRETLREMSDWFREQVTSGATVLGANIDGRPALVAAVTDDLVSRGLRADWLIREVAKVMGGGGGGRATLAEAGGGDSARLREAVARVPTLVGEKLT